VTKSAAETAAVEATTVETATMKAAAVEAAAAVAPTAMGFGGYGLGQCEDSCQSGCSQAQAAYCADPLHVGLLLNVVAESGVHAKKIGARRGIPVAGR
jgi:hypothetical protein